MSDHEFTGFDVATIADAVRQPPLDDLVSVARARRRRRTDAVAFALVVLVVGTAVVPLAVGKRGGDSADPPPAPQVQDRVTELFMTGVDSAVSVEAGDSGCTLRFAHTNDGGRSWTGSEAARYRAAACPPGTTEPNPSRLDYLVLGERSYLVLDGFKSRLSADYGQTWQESDRAIVTVPAFPADARAVFCQQGCTTLRQLLAVDPLTGTVYRLSGQPPSPYPPFSVYPGSDGSIWATYWPGERGVTVVARSIDRGATWNTWQSAKGANVIAVAAVNQREAYLLIEPPPGAQPMEVKGSSQLLRTTDGGATWTDVGTDLPASPVDRPLTIGSDGSLLVARSGNMRPDLISSLLVSRDEGRHFTKEREYNGNDGGVGVAPGQAWLYGRGDVSTQGAHHVVTTRDGSSWTLFPLPG